MAQGWLQIGIFLVVVVALTPPLGIYMARVYRNERVFLTPVLAPVERLTYRAIGVDPEREQDWKGYARTLIVFSGLFFLALYLILRTQSIQPLNPQGFNSAPWDVSFNTTSSFITNTNWQYYGGETTLSDFSQMAGLTVQNFVSAAVGMAVVAALIRGILNRTSKSLGNFFTLRDLLAKGFSGREVRYLLLSAHYRETFNFTLEGLEGARSALARIDECLAKLHELPGERGSGEAFPEFLADFEGALDDDLNVSAAWGVVFDWVRETNRRLAANDLGKNQAASALAAWREIDKVFGLGRQQEAEAPADVQALLEQRQAARKAKDSSSPARSSRRTCRSPSVAIPVVCGRFSQI